MANHKSALKRIKQNSKRRMRNRIVKTRVKTSAKNVISAAEKSGDVSGELKNAQSVIDKAAQKGVIHPRTAARKISRLSRRANTSASA
ncbi:MAG: 30S ribosomal protein S20 [Desulfobacteraceae bacterium]|nr:30S ribosomal protein S20 [Desulfobacteraceae bacterium]MCF8093839.1 30S ribosomal protein S20 [Desulfobacteraceae bacterium]